MHDIINNNSPLNISDLFTKISDVHNYTRSAARKNLYQPQTRLNRSYKSFSSIGVKVWNSLSPSIHSLSKSLFKKKCIVMIMLMLPILCRHYQSSNFIPNFFFKIFDNIYIVKYDHPVTQYVTVSSVMYI